MIVGTPRSGTTLVQRFVTEECGLRGGPESHFFTNVPSLLRKHRRRHAGSEALRAALHEYARIPQLAGCGLDVDRVLEVVPAEPVRLYPVFREVVSQLSGGGSELCEKTPGHLWWWDRLTGHDPSLKLVVVVRDPRAVVASLREARFTALGISVLSEWWKTDQRMVAAAARRLGPHRCQVVRFEDAVEQEHGVRSRISVLHRPLPAPSDPSPEGSGAALALPWETWKHGFDTNPDPGRIDAWRSKLNGRETETIERICGREMSAFGYVPSRRSAGRDRSPFASQPLARTRFRAAVALHRAGQRLARL
jgi:hypothetical protein